MYTLSADNTPIWSPRDPDKRILNPTVNLEVNKVGSLTFKVLPNHSYYNFFDKFKTIITLVQDNRTIFKGRVYSDAEDFRRVKTVTAEGILGYFNDSIVRSYSYSGSVEGYLSMLITQHNSQVEDYQKFKLGNVTVVDDNNYITRASSENPTTWKEIEDKLINILGGYIVIRYEADGNYIDYLDDYEDTSTQPIAFAVNLLDLTLETKGETLATCIIPYGAEDETTGKPIDITSVNDGKDFIYDAEAVAKYGKIYEVVTWEDVTLPANLLRKASAYLGDKIKLTTMITVKAVDLHLSDEEIEAFKLGDYVRVYSEPHEIDERVLLTAYSMDISDPGNCSITLGLEKKSFIKASTMDTANRIDIVKKEIGDNITTEVTNNVISKTQTYVNDQIDNSEEATRTLLKEYVTVTELGEYKDVVSTTFTQTAEGYQLQFDSINERLTTENGEIIDQLDRLSKYIRIVDGNIILGEVGNMLTTKISNGRISFLYNDTLEVAYISDNKLYITQAEVLDRIIIGNYAFIPQGNGSLSFKII